MAKSYLGDLIVPMAEERKRVLLVAARKKRSYWVESARDGSGFVPGVTASSENGEKQGGKRQDAAVDILANRWVWCRHDACESHHHLDVPIGSALVAVLGT